MARKLDESARKGAKDAKGASEILTPPLALLRDFV